MTVAFTSGAFARSSCVTLMRASVAVMFRKNGHVKDPRTVNLLVARGYHELEEALAQFKQKPHIEQLLDNNISVESQEIDFLDDFFAGRNQNAR